MQCPNCQNEVREGAVFCGSCGAAIPAAAPEPPAVPVPAAPVAPVASPAPQAAQTQPLPSAEQAEYERQMAEYQRKQAEYEQQRVAYEQYRQQTAGQTAPQPMAPAPQPSYAQPGVAQPAPRKKTGLIIGIVAGVVLVLGGLAIAGILIARNALEDAVQDIGADIEVPVTGDEGAADGQVAPDDTPAAPTGFASAAEAVTATLQEEGVGDWVSQLYKEDSGSAVYWAGPPNSEWVSELTVFKQGDGTWIVERIEDLQFGGDVPMTAGEEAATVVSEFLVAIQQDRADDAHALTIEPFSLDAASASYSNGQFTAFEIVSIEEQSDGTAWVQTSETWYGTTDSIWYYVVPTEAGYRISSAEVR
ncbi:MAG: zinc ribbon domain-containing protein [Coriobacteriia bacterium]|nr:zinc ribbon domain-containing protein [Coriobacteriia bacterium]MBN2847287.1 zinc ribbon domain-containing protein [Coriobacteriia bacterium]